MTSFCLFFIDWGRFLLCIIIINDRLSNINQNRNNNTPLSLHRSMEGFGSCLIPFVFIDFIVWNSMLLLKRK
jgi:hypothetical protein